jgi:myo-inositol-1(or 4)-monophosphatase
MGYLDENHDRLLESAMKAARAAGDYLLEAQGKHLDIELKSSSLDIVTNADRESQTIIIDQLSTDFPDHRFLAEEKVNDADRSGLMWAVDPIDGTTNFTHGVPHYCVSIALLEGGAPILGLIYEPNRDEMAHAASGRGAFLNGRKLAVSAESDIGKSMLCTGFPYDIRTNPANNLDHFEHFQKTARCVRRFGSAALDLFYVAAGRFDGFWESRLGPWDIAAGVLMVAEAGGTVTNYAGQLCDIFNGEVIASNGCIHSDIVTGLGR